jgi:hypothetical protein
MNQERLKTTPLNHTIINIFNFKNPSLRNIKSSCDWWKQSSSQNKHFACNNSCFGHCDIFLLHQNSERFEIIRVEKMVKIILKLT